MTSEYGLSLTSTLAALDTIISRDPQPAPAQYAGYVQLADGTTRGVGWLMAEWRWAQITTTELAALRAYCSDVSGSVYIITPDIDGVFTTYSAKVVWPQSPEPMHGDYFQDFALQFIQLVAIPGSS